MPFIKSKRLPLVKRILNNLRITERLAPEAHALALSYLAVPVVVLAAFGIYLIIIHGYWLPFILVLSVCSLLPLLFLIFKNKTSSSLSSQEADDEELVQPSSEWGEGDLATWAALNDVIEQQLSEKSDWPTLQSYALDIAALAATQYGKKALSFSTIEGLMLLEELSRRYRKLLEQHVPGIEHLPCSWLHSVYTNKNRIGAGIKFGKGLYDVYRAYRLFSPMGLISELKGQVQAQVWSGVSESLVFRLKQAFLQEVAAVTIDLYSGRFRIESDKLPPSNAESGDQQHMAEPLAPLRVCLIGQVSAGKSSIINALTKDAVTTTVSEVDSLPSTHQASVYPCSVDGCELIHLVDLPGLDGKPETEAFVIDQAVHAHVILWVLKANQPARTLDVDFRKKLDALYTTPQYHSRKKPVIIGVLNQVDRLKPIAAWAPPYDLHQDTSAKATVICEALQYNKTLLGMDVLLPLSVSQDREHYNLCELENILHQHFEQGVQVQLNQRRHQAANTFKLNEQFQRVYRSGKSLFHFMRS